MKEKTWLNDHLKPGQLICLSWVKELCWQRSVEFGLVLFLIYFPENWSGRRIIFPKRWKLNSVFVNVWKFPCISPSQKIPWPDQIYWYRTIALPSESFCHGDVVKCLPNFGPFLRDSSLLLNLENYGNIYIRCIYIYIHSTYRYVWDRLVMLVNCNFNLLTQKKATLTHKYVSIYG